MSISQTQQYYTENENLNHYFLVNNCLYEENCSQKTDNQIILMENINKFSVDIDKSGIPNIVCLDNKYKLFYLSKNKKKWDKKIITKLQSFYKIISIKLYSNLDNINTKNIFLLVKDNRNENTYCIISYAIKNTNWILNKIIDFCYDNSNVILKSDIDNTGNLHILFKTKENNKYKLYYKMYNVKYNTWKLSEKITESKKHLFNTLILCDTNNNVNIAWSSVLDKNIKINFIKRKINLFKKVKWKTYKTLPDSITNLSNPILIQVENSIQFGWKQNNYYNLTQTSLEKDDWQKVSSIKLDYNKQLIPISIIGNKYKDIYPLKAPYSYIYLSKDNKKILGIDKTEDLQINVKKPIQSSITENIKNDTQSNSKVKLSSCLDNINTSIEKSTIIKDICPIIDTQKQSNDLNIFVKKLNNLEKEMESVKNKELNLLNSILEIRKGNNKLYEKIEKIIIDYNESTLIPKE